MDMEGSYAGMAVRTYEPSGFVSLFSVDMSDITVPPTLKAGHAVWLCCEYRRLAASKEKKIDLKRNAVNIARHFAHPLFSFKSDGEIFAALSEVCDLYFHLDHTISSLASNDRSSQLFAFLEEPWPSVKREEDLRDGGQSTLFTGTHPSAAAVEGDNENEERLPEMYVRMDPPTADDREGHERADQNDSDRRDADEQESSAVIAPGSFFAVADADVGIKPDPDADNFYGTNDGPSTAPSAGTPSSTTGSGERVGRIVTPKLNRSLFFTNSAAPRPSNFFLNTMCADRRDSGQQQSKPPRTAAGRYSRSSPTTNCVHANDGSTADADDGGGSDDELPDISNASGMLAEGEDVAQEDSVDVAQPNASVAEKLRSGKTKKSQKRSRQRSAAIANLLNAARQRRMELLREREREQGEVKSEEDDGSPDREQQQERRLQTLRRHEEREARREADRKERISREGELWMSYKARQQDLAKKAETKAREEEQAKKAEAIFIRKQLTVLLKFYRRGELPEKFVLKPEMLRCGPPPPPLPPPAPRQQKAAVSNLPSKTADDAAKPDDEDDSESGTHVVVTRSGRRARLRANFQDLAHPRYNFTGEVDEEESEAEKISSAADDDDTNDDDAGDNNTHKLASNNNTDAEPVADSTAAEKTAADAISELDSDSGDSFVPSETSSQEKHAADKEFVCPPDSESPRVPRRLKRREKQEAITTELRQFEKEHSGRVQAGDGQVRPTPLPAIRRKGGPPVRADLCAGYNRVKCLYCGEILGRSGIFNHIDAHLNAELNVACEHCNLKFTTRHRLGAHCKFVHARTKSFPCKVCVGQVFETRAGYRSHARTDAHVEAEKYWKEHGVPVGGVSLQDRVEDENDLAAAEAARKSENRSRSLIGRVLKQFHRCADGPEFVPLDGDGNEIWPEIDGMDQYEHLRKMHVLTTLPGCPPGRCGPSVDNVKAVTVETKIFREGYCVKCQKYMNYNADSFHGHCRIVHPEMTDDDIAEARCTFWQHRQVKVPGLPPFWRDTHTLETVYTEVLPQAEEVAAECLQGTENADRFPAELRNAASSDLAEEDTDESSSDESSSFISPPPSPPPARKFAKISANRKQIRPPPKATKRALENAARNNSFIDAGANQSVVFPVDLATLVDGPAPPPTAKSRQIKKTKVTDSRSAANSSAPVYSALPLQSNAGDQRAVASVPTNVPASFQPSIPSSAWVPSATVPYFPSGYPQAAQTGQPNGHYQQPTMPAIAGSRVPPGHIVSYDMAEVQRLLAEGWRVERTVFNQ